MPQKGTSNNPNGRPKGSLNHKTASLRIARGEIIDGCMKTIKKDIDSLEPKDRIKILIDLMQYVVPRLQATQLEVGGDSKSKFESTLDRLCNEKGGSDGDTV